LDYCWIQKSIIRNVASKRFKRARDQLSHINHSHTFIPITCTTTKDFDLDLDDFAKLYKLLYFTITIHEHGIIKFLDLLHLLDSWVVYKEKKDIPLVGLHTPPTSKLLEVRTKKRNNHELDNRSWETKQHVGFASNKP